MIAPLDPADPQLHPLLIAAYRVEADLVGAQIPALDESPADVAGAGLQWQGAWDGDRLVGAIAVREEDGVADVHRLVVHPGAFRRGIASALLAQLPQRAVVATAAANLPARALYRRHGFRETREHVAPGGVRIVEMRRP